MTDRDSGATPVGDSPRDDDYGRRDTNAHDDDYTSDRTTDINEANRSQRQSGQEHVESRTAQSHERPVVTREREPAVRDRHDYDNDHDRGVAVALGTDRHDGVRWGPVWAGLLTALTSFLLLELAFYAAGALDLGVGSSSNDGILTGILALVAFFIGGLIAGATALWKGLFSGLLHGFLVWALGVVAFIALTFFGASALLGSFGDLTSELGVGPQEVASATEVTEEEAAETDDAAQDAAGPAFWGLLLPLIASMLGGLIGSKIWPRKKDQDIAGADRVHR